MLLSKIINIIDIGNIGFYNVDRCSVVDQYVG